MFLKINLGRDLFDKSVIDFLQKVPITINDVKEQIGPIKCTLVSPKFDPAKNIKNFEKTVEKEIFPYLTNYIELITKQKIKHINICKYWINEFFLGSSGNVHIHRACDFVVLYYYRAPKNSSQFVIIENIEANKLNVNEYSEYEKSCISVNTGDLLIHNSNVWHGISEHKCEESRICFIFDIKVEFK